MGIIQVTIVDGKMIDIKTYYDLLYKCLDKNNLLPVEAEDQWRTDFQKYIEETEIDLNIISEMKAAYGIGFENVFLVNCKKFVLLCRSFKVKRNKLQIQTSVYFTVLGCLLDWLLDHGNANQRQEAQDKLNWDYCGDYFCKAISAKDNSVIDILYEKISLGMCAILRYNHERFDYIINMVKAAIDSELAVSIENSGTILDNCILNKSVLFVQIAAEIVLAEKEKMTDSDRKLIADVGYAFALIDDLCDLYEDMESGQMNLLMTHGISDDIDIEIVINSIVNQLTEKLHSIQEMTDSPFYEFVLHEIREWSMSSMELRKRMWYING